eukprot:scaffold6095_cov92-Isochrysis_galbana.AAC.4
MQCEGPSSTATCRIATQRAATDCRWSAPHPPATCSAAPTPHSAAATTLAAQPAAASAEADFTPALDEGSAAVVTAAAGAASTSAAACAAAAATRRRVDGGTGLGTKFLLHRRRSELQGAPTCASAW